MSMSLKQKYAASVSKSGAKKNKRSLYDSDLVTSSTENETATDPYSVTSSTENETATDPYSVTSSTENETATDPYSVTSSTENETATEHKIDPITGTSGVYYRDQPAQAEPIPSSVPAVEPGADYPDPALDAGISIGFRVKVDEPESHYEHWSFGAVLEQCKQCEGYYTESGKFDNQKFIEMLRKKPRALFWETKKTDDEGNNVSIELNGENFKGVNVAKLTEQIDEPYMDFLVSLLVNYEDERNRLKNVSKKFDPLDDDEEDSSPASSSKTNRVMNMVKTTNNDAEKAVIAAASGPVVPETPAPVAPTLSTDATPTAPAEDSAATKDSVTDDEETVTVTRSQLTTAISAAVGDVLTQLGINIS